MPSKIQIRNVEPASKVAGGAAEEVKVKVTGGGPAKEAKLPPGGELEFTVGQGQKITVTEGEDQDEGQGGGGGQGQGGGGGQGQGGGGGQRPTPRR